MNRVQRKRTPGYRLPPKTLCVTRGTKWGNRWRVKPDGANWLVTDGERQFRFDSKHQAHLFAVMAFQGEMTPVLIRQFIEVCQERGIENVACFCPPELPCHADVWIDVAERVLDK